MTNFPSLTSLEELAAAMNTDEERFAKLGVVDCKVGISVTDTGEGFTVEFERYGVAQVTEGVGQAEFVLEADSDVWQAMYHDIVAHGSAEVVAHAQGPVGRDLARIRTMALGRADVDGKGSAGTPAVSVARRGYD